MIMTKLIFVRHGESKANVTHKIAGHTDFPLTEIGLEQAKQTADYLSVEPIAAVYSSDLSRAMATARPHAERRGLEVIPSVALRELNCGEWENVEVDLLREREPQRYGVGFCRNFLWAEIPGGESIPDCARRFGEEVVRIAKAHEGQTVLIASHGATIRIFFAMISGLPLEEANEKFQFPSNSSYSVAEFDGNAFSITEYSKDDHLTIVTSVHL